MPHNLFNSLQEFKLKSGKTGKYYSLAALEKATQTGTAFVFGYLGGGVLFAFNVLMTLKPDLFGIADAATAVRISFLLVPLIL